MDDGLALDPDTEVGRPHRAESAANAWFNQYRDLDRGTVPHWMILGTGSYRVGLLDTSENIVYKVPVQVDFARMGAAEAMYWRMMRSHPEYAEFVPPHTVYEVDLREGDGILCVTAMPYLGERTIWPPRQLHSPWYGTPLAEAAEHVGCWDVSVSNTRQHRGQWYVIDAGGHENDEGDFGPTPKDGCEKCTLYRSYA